ncbi:MAG: penicillin-binding protein, partial [Myxococcales bacterium]|nr:penicillin-binding protein [Myxococcales bacterium]
MARGRFRVLRVLVTLFVVGALLAAAGGIALYFALLRDLPDLAPLEDYRPALTSVVLDRDGQPVGEFYEHRRRITPLEELPNHLIQAFIAAEDDTFYEHAGVDYVSILRAAWANLRAGGETRQGASTITQQMVKQLLLTPERTYRRKLREMILARRIEQRFSKEQILFLYLNEIYFGAGAYGVGEAARTYFAKDVRTISVSEAALLAGLPKAPGRNSPYRNPERAEARRRYVVERLAEEGYIDPETREVALAEIPELAAPPGESDFDVAAYFVEEVRRTLVEELGNETVLRGGLT